MNLIKLAISNLISKPLQSLLCVLLLALGVGLVGALFSINQQFEQRLEKDIEGIEMAVGAKGSPLQLILSSVYHVDFPTGNIPLWQAEAYANNPFVDKAMLLAFGDNYKAFRIVGCGHNYPKHYNTELAEGRLYVEDMEVTIGALVADELDLKIGSTFVGTHGLVDAGHVHENQRYRVVGIFKPNNSVIDKLILGNISSVWSVHHEEEDIGHDSHHNHDHHGHHHHNHHHHDVVVPPNYNGIAKQADTTGQSITAMLLKFKGPMGQIRISNSINNNENTSLMAALPSIELDKLRKNVGIGMETIALIVFLIIIVSAISVFVSLLNSLKDRSYELALFRSMGASRSKLFGLVVAEGILLAAIGFLVGLVLSKVGLLLFSSMAANAYQYQTQWLNFGLFELILLAASLLLGFVAALFPAIKAFNLNISKTLANG